MTRDDADKLKVGDRLVFNEGTEWEARGVVVARSDLAVFTEWDDGRSGAVHVDDMKLYRTES